MRTGPPASLPHVGSVTLAQAGRYESAGATSKVAAATAAMYRAVSEVIRARSARVFDPLITVVVLAASSIR
ncbi:hypothetical protein GALL_454470 [mine drainage metagenome]|uniref:Uncharacterized protein n=1 Tax=mine drainage metagenome TaxID=410659 RepID=A0A1J5PP32_9ZZZZ